MHRFFNVFSLAALALLVVTGVVPSQAPAPARPPVAASNQIVLVVRVPADAVVEVEGSRTKLTGEVRNFYSPALQAGRTYLYALRATWAENGKEVVRTREVSAKPGQTIEVDLRQEQAVQAAPKIAKKESPKVVGVKKDEKPLAVVVKKDEMPKVPEKPRLLVPFVPTPEEIVDEMLKLAEIKKDDVVYDLGCGDGRIVITAAKKFGARGVGVDLDPQRVKESQDNVKKANVESLVEIRQGDVLQTDVAGASVVTLYLLPEVNLRVRPNLLKQLKPGSRIVSHDFDMGDWKPLKKIDVKDNEGVEHTLFLWRIEAPKN